MTPFQRARSEEQREQRRRAILDTAAAMLAEMPVAQVSLNELSRRVGLAKSNVLRYFESREAVLLDLLDSAWQSWLEELPTELGEGVDHVDRGDTARRADQIAAVIARSLSGRPVLCDLISAQASVLEHNVSAGVAARSKRAWIAGTATLAGAVVTYLPELGAQAAGQFAAIVVLATGAVWTNARPSDAMVAAYRAEPDLAALRMDITTTLREILATILAGLLARGPARGLPGGTVGPDTTP